MLKITHLQTSNKIMGGLIILANTLYFIPFLIKIVSNSGGPMGFGLIPGLIAISTAIFLVPAILTFKRSLNSNPIILFFNIIGAIWIMFWAYIILSTPYID
jgi:hypothetical protein